MRKLVATKAQLEEKIHLSFTHVVHLGVYVNTKGRNKKDPEIFNNSLIYWNDIALLPKSENLLVP